MKYVFLGNNRTAVEALRWLIAEGHRPAGLVVHPPNRAKFREDLIALAALPPDRVIEAGQLHEPSGREWLRAIGPDWLLSVLFGDRLHDDVLSMARNGGINLHPALLPFNKGANPNVWSIVDGTPAGVTLHMMTAAIDCGDIIAQTEVPVDVCDTGATLYRKLEDASVRLLIDTWPSICAGSFPRRQQHEAGTSHRVADLEVIDRILPQATYRGQDIINVIRARTFPPYKGAYLDLGDRRVYLRLTLEEEPAGPANPH